MLPPAEACYEQAQASNMDSVLELQRQTHEEIERYERALATVLSKPATSQQTKLSNEHHASEILDRITSRAKTLSGLYKDEEGRKRETDALSGSKADDMTEFYARLGRIKEHHLKYPDQTVGGFELELAALVDADPEDYDEENEEEDRMSLDVLSSNTYLMPISLAVSLLFSGEESYGRYFDLYLHHTAYCNLKNINKRPSYLQYLDILSTSEHGLIHQELPTETRTSKDYEL